MNPLQIKTFLWSRGLTISQIARELEVEYDATFDSLRIMLTDLFYHGKYNSKLAHLVKAKYGLKIEKPERPQTVKEAVQRAA
jgi:hypothetical protein